MTDPWPEKVSQSGPGRHVCFVSGAGRNGKNGLLSQKYPQAAHICKQENMFLLVLKRHHTNQSQNYKPNHVIWLLRNKESCRRVADGRVTAAVAEIQTAMIEIVSFES